MMDAIDLEIAKILAKNARVPFRKIAKQLKISPQMVSRRYEKLKKTVFSYSSVMVNLEKLGFKASVGFCIKVAKEKQGEIDQIYDKITKLPNVIVGGVLLGAVDMCFLVPVRDLSEIFDFQKHLSEIEGIEEVEITLYKVHQSWPRQLYQHFLQNVNNAKNE
ncbi:MAG: Lrp/AsnC family transcriptional regulator [Candidatus Bathyarchaeota archaeon]|nr:Lrp/AsnC family transcriptional regulator [Candidatus Bathyarchaeota archaeon]